MVILRLVLLVAKYKFSGWHQNNAKSYALCNFYFIN